MRSSSLVLAILSYLIAVSFPLWLRFGHGEEVHGMFGLVALVGTATVSVMLSCIAAALRVSAHRDVPAPARPNLALYRLELAFAAGPALAFGALVIAGIVWIAA